MTGADSFILSQPEGSGPHWVRITFEALVTRPLEFVPSAQAWISTVYRADDSHLEIAVPGHALVRYRKELTDGFYTNPAQSNTERVWLFRRHEARWYILYPGRWVLLGPDEFSDIQAGIRGLTLLENIPEEEAE